MTDHKLICVESGIRVDKFIADSDLGISRSAAAGLIEKELVTVNGCGVSKKHKLSEGDTVEVNVPDPVEYDAKA